MDGRKDESTDGLEDALGVMQKRIWRDLERQNTEKEERRQSGKFLMREKKSTWVRGFSPWMCSGFYLWGEFHLSIRSSSSNRFQRNVIFEQERERRASIWGYFSNKYASSSLTRILCLKISDFFSYGGWCFGPAVNLCIYSILNNVIWAFINYRYRH